MNWQLTDRTDWLDLLNQFRRGRRGHEQSPQVGQRSWGSLKKATFALTQALNSNHRADFTKIVSSTTVPFTSA